MKGFHWKLLTAAGVFLVLLGLGLAGYFSKSASSQPAPVPFSWPTNQSGLPPGGTPLHGAARFGNASIIASLVRSGSGVDVRDGIGGTSLHWAVSGGSVENAKTLLRLGADINATDKLGNTPLHLVSRNDYDVIPVPPPPPWQVRLANRWPQTRKPMQWLIKHRLLPAPKPVTGPMPTTTWLDVLVEHRANVNVTNLAGETPLHLLAGRQAQFSAATSNLVHRMSRLLNAGAQVDARDAAGETPLAFAVRAGSLEVAEALHRAGASVRVTNNAGDTLLHHSVTERTAYGSTNLTAWLLDRGAPINARNSAGRTPLHEWLQPQRNMYSAAPMVTLLLDRGADWTIADARGRTPLHEIAANQMGSFTPLMQPLVGRLAAPPANPLAFDLDGNLPIDLALRSNRLSTASAIIQHGGLPLVTNHGQTTLFHTIAGRREWFLAMGAALRAVSPPTVVVDVPDVRGETPLLLATRQGDSTYILWLLERGADVARLGRDGSNFLHHLANNMESLALQPEVINQLRKRLTPEVPVDIPDELGNTPLLLATRGQHVSMINLLVEKGARSTVTNRLGESALLLEPSVLFVNSIRAPGASNSLRDAAIQGDLTSVQAALSVEPRLATNSAGQSALVWASRLRHTNIVESLLAAGTPLDLESAIRLGRGSTVRSLIANGRLSPAEMGTQLFTALGHRRREYVEALLKAGADPNVADRFGHSPLFRARGTEMLDVLRRHGARENVFDAVGLADTGYIAELAARDVALVNASATEGWTPLFAAILSTNSSVVAALLKAGANPNYAASYNDTPTHLAARLDQVSLLKLLREHGAAMQDRDVRGRTPLHHAASLGRLAAVEYLLSCGLNPNDQSPSSSFGSPYLLTTPLHLAARFGHFEVVECLLRHGGNPDIKQRQGLTVADYVQTARLGGSSGDHLSLSSLTVSTRMVPSNLRTEADRQRMLELLERHQAQAKSAAASPVAK